MKKSVAMLLSLACVLSMVGCKDKSESSSTRTTRETKETTEESSEDTSEETSEETSSETTEETTTETTEETTTETTTETTEETSETSASESETSETSETTESSETSETTNAPAAPATMTISHDLKVVDWDIDLHYAGYGELPKGYYQVARIEESCKGMKVTGEGFDKLSASIDSFFAEVNKKYDEMYAELFNGFDEAVKNNNTYYSRYISTDVSVTRADSQICSFILGEVNNTTDFFGINGYGHNYDTATGAEIKFSDVVTDKALFASKLESAKLTGSNYEVETTRKYIDAMVAELKKGNDLEFVLYPNAISVMISIASGDSYSSTQQVVLSVADLGDCVNLSYFGSTTKYYTLIADCENKFRWDFDGDGSIDTLAFENVSSDYYLNYKYTLNGEQISCDKPQLEGDDFQKAYMIYTDDGWYLYVQYGMEDPTPYISIFEFAKDELTFVEEKGAFARCPSNPEKCTIESRSDLMGTGHVDIPCAIIGNKGVPTQNGDFLTKDGMGAAREEMVLGLWADGQPTGDSIVIPKGQVVRLIGIDTKNNLVKFAIVDKNIAEAPTFDMVAVSSDYEKYDVKFDGKNAYQLFDGCTYAD